MFWVVRACVVYGVFVCVLLMFGLLLFALCVVSCVRVLLVCCSGVVVCVISLRVFCFCPCYV